MKPDIGLPGYLDTHNEEQMRKVIEDADHKVWEKINCLECANCCKTRSPVYSEEDINRISNHLELNVDQFIKRYLLQLNNGDWVNISIPCQFLQADNKCSVYELRPATCASYPHHNKKPLHILKEHLQKNISTCPASVELIGILNEKE